MDDRRKAGLSFAALAALSAASTASVAADATGRPIFIVLPLLVMGVCLLFAGYYAGLSRATR